MADFAPLCRSHVLETISKEIAMNCIAPIGLACCFLSSTPIHAATLRTVALSGQQVPGALDGTIIFGFPPTTPVVLNGPGGFLEEMRACILVNCSGNRPPADFS
jgi:hypothetical protein